MSNDVPATTGENEHPQAPSRALARVTNSPQDHADFASERGWLFVNLDDVEFEPRADALALVPGRLARQLNAFPVELKSKTLLVAIDDPADVARGEQLRVQTTGYRVRLAYANPHTIRRLIDSVYSASREAATLARAEDERRRNAKSTVADGGDIGRVQGTERSSTSEILDLTIESALRQGTSDIHFEPTEYTMEVRIRVDGELRHEASYSRDAAANLMTKIKVDSPGMRTDNFMVPDSGVMRYTPRNGGEPVDIRIEVTPVAWGAGAVMRLQQNIWRPLDSIGFSERNEKRVRAALHQPDGIFLATGPTGSGKDLPVSTPIPTPTGWTTMGELVDGDLVLGRDGRPAPVTAAWPVIERPELYRVSFADGQTQLAGRDHQWLVRPLGSTSTLNAAARATHDASERDLARFAVRTLRHLTESFPVDATISPAVVLALLEARGIDVLFPGRRNGIAAAIASTDHASVAHHGAPRPVSPDSPRPARMALAALARRLEERYDLDPEETADPKDSTGVVPATGVDTGLVRMTTGELLAAMDAVNDGPYGYPVPSRHGDAPWRYAVPATAPVEYPALDGPAAEVRFYELGTWIASDAVIGAMVGQIVSDDPAVDEIRFAGRLPGHVLRARVEDRDDLVAGVMDNLGHVDAHGDCVLKMSASPMRDDVVTVLRSLGLVVREGTDRVTFRTDRAVFRKAFDQLLAQPLVNETYNEIVSIVPVSANDPDYEPTRCITVASPDHTYLCGTGFLVTSNTTLMYSLVNEKIDVGTKIITLENPIEYKVPELVEQISVNFEQGMTFASGLRSILRRDPNVVLVGEIRDRETAETAVDASMTGHLLLSTLHTNDAPGVIPRLLRLGVDPFLLSSSLLGVVGQRLVKSLCDECKIEVVLAREVVEANGFDPDTMPAYVYEPNLAGCEACRGGFGGRVPIHEVMLVGEELSEAIADNASETAVRRLAREAGMTTMREDGWEKVRAGITTLDEVNNSTRRKLV